MPKLGDFFPKEVRDDVAEAKLNAGVIIRRHCEFTTPPKIKYLLVACVDPKLLVFVINSEINPYIENRAHLKACQVKLDAANYLYLDHDSFSDCIDVKDVINLTTLKQEMTQSYADIYQGELEAEDIRAVIEAANRSMVMVNQNKQLITEALNQALSERK